MLPHRLQHSNRLPAALLSLLALLGPAGCGDGEGDPLALALAPETHGAVAFSELLPGVPLLVSHLEAELQGSADLEAWWESWSMSEEEGRRLRASIYPPLARRLLPGLGTVGVEEVLSRNHANLTAVEQAGVATASEELQFSLVRAGALQLQAEESLAEGDLAGALSLALQSVDAQWAVSPAQVARSLVGAAERSLRRISGPDAYSEEDLSRIRRLTRGAQEALKAGDYPRAIRRAYYACQLLGVDPP